MQLLTDNIKEIELFGTKLLLSERTARDVNILQKYSSEGVKDGFDGVMQSALIIRDGLKINLLQFNEKPIKWYELKRKKEFKKLSSIINVEKILELPIRVISDLSIEVLKLEGIDVEALKKKMNPVLETERDGLAVTLQTDLSPISSE